MATIGELVERFDPGSTFTVQEFTDVLLALLPYSDSRSAFEVFAQRGLEFAETLDPNTVLITLKKRNGVIYPVATPGLITSVD